MATVTLRKSGGSVTVTIPPSYLKEAGLTVGSMVTLNIQGNKLTVSPAHKGVTLEDILESAPEGAHKLRVTGWDEMTLKGIEVYEDAFEALFEPGEAAVQRARANLIRAVRIALSDLNDTRLEKAAQLKIKSARFDLLLAPESMSEFSLSDLIKFAVRVGLSPRIQIGPSLGVQRRRTQTATKTG